MKIQRLRMLLALAALAGAAHAGTVHVPKDQPTIEAGINAAADGDTVVISGGTYVEAVTATNRSGLTLKAAGKVVIDAIGSSPALALGQCADIHISGLSFTDGSGDAILLENCDLVTFSKCRITGFSGGGLHADACGHVGLDHVTFSGVSGTVIGLPGADGETDCNDFIVTHCKILDPAPGATSLRLYGDDGIFTNNVVTGLPGSAFSDFGRNTTFGGTVTGNHFTNSGFTCDSGAAIVTDNVLIESPLTVLGAGLDVEHNVCKATQNAFSAFNASSSLISGNHITQLGAAVNQGLLLNGCFDTQVTDNVVKGTPSFGIEFVSCSSSTATGNVVSKAGLAGFGLLASSTLTVQDNAIKGCAIGILFASGSANIGLVGNHVNGSTGDGLQIGGDSGPITANVVHGSHGNGVHLLAGANNNVLSANVAKGSKGFDLLDESGGANTIQPDNHFGTTSP